MELNETSKLRVVIAASKVVNVIKKTSVHCSYNDHKCSV